MIGNTGNHKTLGFCCWWTSWNAVCEIWGPHGIVSEYLGLLGYDTETSTYLKALHPYKHWARLNQHHPVTTQKTWSPKTEFVLLADIYVVTYMRLLLWDLKLLLPCWWRFRLLQCDDDDDVFQQVVPDVAKGHGAFIFRVKQSTSWTGWPWR